MKKKKLGPILDVLKLVYRNINSRKQQIIVIKHVTFLIGLVSMSLFFRNISSCL